MKHWADALGGVHMIAYRNSLLQHGGDANIPGLAIGSVKVYTGGVPARYGDFTGGCIVIETQSYFNWLSSLN